MNLEETDQETPCLRCGDPVGDNPTLGLCSTCTEDMDYEIAWSAERAGKCMECGGPIEGELDERGTGVCQRCW